MRLIAALLLTVLCFGLSAADFTAADLTAIADKAKTMKVGEASSIKVMVDGKAVYVGLVMGASGVTVAGEGVPAGSYKFLYTNQGLVVQSTQAGQTKTVAVANGRVEPASNDLARAFGAGAVSTWAAVQSERLAAARTADEQARAADDARVNSERAAGNEFAMHRIRGLGETWRVSHDLNSLTMSIHIAFMSRPIFNRPNFRIPAITSFQVTQTNSNQQAVITNNASGAQPN